ncbi:hypothetical protein [Paractinoplanes lichenicola]|uniref:DUF4190 domain-containing protein n=1 Tax=Paractinoplanes lichenicola TaxID=2802976 RepID=A0ABS1VT99_9ACTN|nr:hypothetical protein [Actinoplanes lichenicola]MBL7257689.1 hypothetical protein [Actinoplanes lichenicola]
MERRRNGTNGYSIAALILAFVGLGLPLSIVAGVIGLIQSRRDGDRLGRDLAEVALGICALWIAGIAAFVAFAGEPDGTDRGGSSFSPYDITTSSVRD